MCRNTTLGRRLLLDLSLLSRRRRDGPPGFEDQEDDGDKHDEHISAEESGEHVHLAPEDGTIGLECPRHDPALFRGGAVAGPVPAQARRGTHGAGELGDVPRTERQHVGRDARQAEAEVLLEPREAALEREHLVADGAAEELDDGRCECGAVERGVHAVLDLLVELHDGVVDRVRRGRGEPEEVVVHGRGGVVEPLVDGRCVRGAVDTNRIGDLVLYVLGEIADDDAFRVGKVVLKRLDESELDERSGDTDGANEKAHERGRIGGVRDKPCKRVSGLRLQLENSRKEARCARADGLLKLSVEREDVLIGKLERGKRSRSRSSGVRPLFAYLVGGCLN